MLLFQSKVEQHYTELVKKLVDEFAELLSNDVNNAQSFIEQIQFSEMKKMYINNATIKVTKRL